MSKSVPVWLAVAGAGVGLALGSMNLGEKIWALVSTDKPRLSERYIVAQVPVEAHEEARTFFSAEYMNLEDSLFLETELLQTAIAAMDDAEGLSEKCLEWKVYELSEDTVRDRFAGCSVSSVTVAFFGLRNDSNSDIAGLEIFLDRYENDQHPTLWSEDGFVIEAFSEEQAREFSDSEEDFQEKRKCLMTWDRLASSGECISRMVDEDHSIGIPQPIRPGETVFLPIYIGYSLSLKLGNQTSDATEENLEVYDTNILQPQSVAWRGSMLIESVRPISPVPTLRVGTRIREHG